VTVALAIIVAVLIMVWGFMKAAIRAIAVSACLLPLPVGNAPWYTAILESSSCMSPVNQRRSSTGQAMRCNRQAVSHL
jgi:hypothetical protein